MAPSINVLSPEDPPWLIDSTADEAAKLFAFRANVCVPIPVKLEASDKL